MGEKEEECKDPEGREGRGPTSRKHVHPHARRRDKAAKARRGWEREMGTS